MDANNFILILFKTYFSSSKNKTTDFKVKINRNVYFCTEYSWEECSCCARRVGIW